MFAAIPELKGVIQTLVDNVVGNGLKLVSIPDHRILGLSLDYLEEWARKVEGLWRIWAESNYCDAARKLNFNSQTALIFRSVIENGEALALVLWRESKDLRHIGTGLNIPLELLMKDFSKTNYSSARASLIEAWRFFNGRRSWIINYWAKPVFELWLEECVNKGLIEAPNFYENKAAWCRCKWIGPGRGWVDPVKEAQASQIRMETGLSTLEDECASQGLDWEARTFHHLKLLSF